MSISAAQCRAARALLNWTQELLATNACVSRATIADFENSSRLPMTNNIRSMADSMFAAGVEFIPEQNTLGVGVRFRERKLQYISNLKIDRFRRRATMRMVYAGQHFICHIELNAVDDYHQSSFRTDEEYSLAISKILHIILASVENRCSINPPESEMLVTVEMLQ
jgi:transcriptional regulator with XRE-family HTH domain